MRDFLIFRQEEISAMHNNALFLSQCSTLSLSFLFQLFGQVFTCWVRITEILMHCESPSLPPLFFFSPSIFHADGDVTDGNLKFSPSSESSVETQRACGERNISTYSSCIYSLINIFIILQILISLISFLPLTPLPSSYRIF